ncbi:MAG: glutamate--tRNA ligase, partial [Phycisphaerae bacterium]|nr:glutamate--tRNA ligase [Phycisphaerae bacterium]
KNSDQGLAVLTEMRQRLAGCPWTAGDLEALLKSTCESSGLGMGKVAQPIRVAVTGRTISPPIFDTLTLLGRQKTLARIDRCLATFSKKP